jgi:hypothetical protein
MPTSVPSTACFVIYEPRGQHRALRQVDRSHSWPNDILTRPTTFRLFWLAKS